MALGACVALSACGGDDSSANPTSSDGTTASSASDGSSANATASSAKGAAQTSSSATASKAAFPATVQSVYGEVVVPAEPERVVVLTLDALEAALALGIEPVGAPSGLPFGPWVKEKIDVTDTSVFSFPNPSSGDLSIEHIASLHPDLILSSVYGVPEDRNPLLSAIAPTVVRDDIAGTSTAGAWEETIRQFGAAVGRSEEAEVVIADVLEQIEDTKAAYPASEGKTVIFAGLSPNGLSVTLGEKHSGMRLLSALGLTPADLGASGSEYAGGRMALSVEQIGLLDQADLVIIAAFNADLAAQLDANPLYQGLAAVQQGRVLLLDTSSLYAMNTPTALNIPALIDQIDPYLSKLGS